MGTIFYKDEMYSGGGGSNVRELSKSAYNALSTYEKNNGTLYLVNGRTGVTNQVTNITIDKYLENSSVCTDTVSQDGTSVVSEWLGGGQIGNNFWFVDKIDVTIYDHISYDLDLGTCYGTSATWNYTVGLMSAIPNTWWYANNTADYVVKKTHDTVEITYTDQQLDVSNLTGEYYIAVVAHGWNATLSNIRLVTVNSLPNDIYYKGTQFAQTIKRDTLFSNSGTTNPSTITLNKALTDYDEVLIQLKSTGYDATFAMEYDVADLDFNATIGAGGTTGVFVWYYYTNATTLTYRTDSSGNAYISKIVGKKY